MKPGFRPGGRRLRGRAQTGAESASGPSSRAWGDLLRNSDFFHSPYYVGHPEPVVGIFRGGCRTPAPKVPPRLHPWGVQGGRGAGGRGGGEGAGGDARSAPRSPRPESLRGSHGRRVRRPTPGPHGQDVAGNTGHESRVSLVGLVLVGLVLVSLVRVVVVDPVSAQPRVVLLVVPPVAGVTPPVANQVTGSPGAGSLSGSVSSRPTKRDCGSMRVERVTVPQSRQVVTCVVGMVKSAGGGSASSGGDSSGPPVRRRDATLARYHAWPFQRSRTVRKLATSEASAATERSTSARRSAPGSPLRRARGGQRGSGRRVPAPIAERLDEPCPTRVALLRVGIEARERTGLAHVVRHERDPLDLKRRERPPALALVARGMVLQALGEVHRAHVQPRRVPVPHVQGDQRPPVDQAALVDPGGRRWPRRSRASPGTSRRTRRERGPACPGPCPSPTRPRPGRAGGPNDRGGSSGARPPRRPRGRARCSAARARASRPRPRARGSRRPRGLGEVVAHPVGIRLRHGGDEALREQAVADRPDGRRLDFVENLVEAGKRWTSCGSCPATGPSVGGCPRNSGPAAFAPAPD